MTADIWSELQGLKSDTEQRLGAINDALRDGSEWKADAFVDHVKDCVADFKSALERGEKQAERAIAERGATALVSALVVGIVIGWALRRKS
jgi:hypothetical protein